MNTPDSMSTSVGLPSIDATWAQLPGVSPHLGLDFLRPEMLLSEPNRDASNQTQVRHINGTSETLNFASGLVLGNVPALHPSREYFVALQKWEGQVIEVTKDTFLARLVRLVGDGTDQDAEIWLEEVTPDDRRLVKPGAVFYWSVGYLERPQGRLRTSIIRFRRLPTWTRRELDAAEETFTRLRDLLDGE